METETRVRHNHTTKPPVSTVCEQGGKWRARRGARSGVRVDPHVGCIHASVSASPSHTARAFPEGHAPHVLHEPHRRHVSVHSERLIRQEEKAENLRR